MQQHLLDHNLAGVLHSKGDHGQAVADEDHVHAGSIGNMGTGKVVGGHHRDRLTPPVQRAEGADVDLLPWVYRRCAHRRVRAVADMLRDLDERPDGG